MIRSGQSPLPTLLPGLWRGALSILALLLLFAAPLAADEILQQGQWKGKYWPANLGLGVSAIFCVQPGDTDDTDKPPWKVTMELKLPSPGDEPVEFDFQQTDEDGQLNFRFKLLGVFRECQFKGEIEDELTFECKLVDSQSDKPARLTMKRDVPQPNDICLPEPTTPKGKAVVDGE